MFSRALRDVKMRRENTDHSLRHASPGVTDGRPTHRYLILRTVSDAASGPTSDVIVMTPDSSQSQHRTLQRVSDVEREVPYVTNDWMLQPISDASDSRAWVCVSHAQNEEQVISVRRLQRSILRSRDPVGHRLWATGCGPQAVADRARGLRPRTGDR